MGCTSKISQSIYNTRILSIFYNINDALSIIKNDTIDVIIYDSSNQNLTNEKFVQSMEHLNFKKIFIVISKSKSTTLFGNNTYIYLNGSDKNKLINEIYQEISQLAYESIIKKIQIELKKLNFNFSHIGTTYLIRTIYEVSKLSSKSSINFSKEIFPIVGVVFNKSANTIHSGIKKSILNMTLDCEEKTLVEYFDCYCFDERPKLKEMVFTILMKIENM